MMNNFSKILLLACMFAFGLFSSCNEEETPKRKPTVTSTPSTMEGAEGEKFTITVNWSAEAGIAGLTCSSPAINIPSGLSGTNGTFDTEFTLGSEDETVTFIIVDLDGAESSDSFIATVSAIKTITDDDLIGGETYNFTKDKQYLLDGLVYLEKGGKLNIEAGTIIKFKKSPSSSDPTSVLIITRGAQIFAEGTSEAPIIFTAEVDDVTQQSLLPSENQQWAGLVILGSAPVMKSGNTLLQIEGISTNEPRGRYGWGDSDFPSASATENSGTLKYVSIRYTGFALNGQSGDEIQGLTLGGVGSGTTIDYVESFSSDDDGIEIFGGTVDLKHFIVAFAADDSYDFDQGWRGTGQYLFALQGDGAISKYDHLGEWDGFGNASDNPFTAPNILNATFIGPGQNLADTLSDRAILWREGFAGKVINSIVTDVPNYAIQIRNEKGDNVSSCATITAPRDGYQSEIYSTTWSIIGPYDGNDINSALGGQCNDAIAPMLTDNDCVIVSDGILENISSRTSAIDPRPKNNFTGGTKSLSDLGILGEQTDYQGAFEPGQDLWLKGWSTLSKYGYTIQ